MDAEWKTYPNGCKRKVEGKTTTTIYPDGTKSVRVKCGDLPPFSDEDQRSFQMQIAARRRMDEEMDGMARYRHAVESIPGEIGTLSEETKRRMVEKGVPPIFLGITDPTSEPEGK